MSGDMAQMSSEAFCVRTPKLGGGVQCPCLCGIWKVVAKHRLRCLVPSVPINTYKTCKNSSLLQDLLGVELSLSRRPAASGGVKGRLPVEHWHRLDENKSCHLALALR